MGCPEHQRGWKRSQVPKKDLIVCFPRLHSVSVWGFICIFAFDSFPAPGFSSSHDSVAGLVILDPSQYRFLLTLVILFSKAVLGSTHCCPIHSTFICASVEFISASAFPSFLPSLPLSLVPSLSPSLPYPHAGSHHTALEGLKLDT